MTSDFARIRIFGIIVLMSGCNRSGTDGAPAPDASAAAATASARPASVGRTPPTASGAVRSVPLVGTSGSASARKAEGPVPSAAASSSGSASANLIPPESPPDPIAARKTAVSWLAALAREDREAVVAHSSSMLTVTGFRLPSGPEREACGTDTERVGELTSRATDSETLAKLVGCVVKDLMLVDAIPRYSLGEWPEEESAPDSRGRVGYLKPLRSSGLPPRLQRYQTQISAEAGAKMMFYLLDGGITAYGVIIVRKVGGEPRVSAVFLDERFQE